jgi:hypothetical protein
MNCSRKEEGLTTRVQLKQAMVAGRRNKNAMNSSSRSPGSHDVGAPLPRPPTHEPGSAGGRGGGRCGDVSADERGVDRRGDSATGGLAGRRGGSGGGAKVWLGEQGGSSARLWLGGRGEVAADAGRRRLLRTRPPLLAREAMNDSVEVVTVILQR